jgi:hypothetical protein
MAGLSGRGGPLFFAQPSRRRAEGGSECEYFFTSATGNTIPQQLASATGTVTPGAMLSYVIVAAGTSTCVPSVPPQ